MIVTTQETTQIGGKPQHFTIRQVTMEQPWRWLAAGWSDLWRSPGISLAYGALLTAVSFCVTAGLFLTGLEYLLLPMLAGFMLLGPMLAVGLYEISRRHARNESVSLKDALFVKPRSPGQLAFIGVLLTIVILAWMRIATLLFALFFSTLDIPPLDQAVQLLLFTYEGLSMLALGTVIGGIFAATVFAVSVVSIPLLVSHQVDAVTAIIVSLRAVRDNLKVMILWAWLVVMVTACGLVTLFAGLIITFPLIGHATWHAYRDLVEEKL
jgi:uncharacterized membrane protein